MLPNRGETHPPGLHAVGALVRLREGVPFSQLVSAVFSAQQAYGKRARSPVDITYTLRSTTVSNPPSIALSSLRSTAVSNPPSIALSSLPSTPPPSLPLTQHHPAQRRALGRCATEVRRFSQSGSTSTPRSRPKGWT